MSTREVLDRMADMLTGAHVSPVFKRAAVDSLKATQVAPCESKASSLPRADRLTVDAVATGDAEGSGRTTAHFHPVPALDEPNRTECTAPVHGRAVPAEHGEAQGGATDGDGHHPCGGMEHFASGGAESAPLSAADSRPAETMPSKSVTPQPACNPLGAVRIYITRDSRTRGPYDAVADKHGNYKSDKAAHGNYKHEACDIPVDVEIISINSGSPGVMAPGDDPREVTTGEAHVAEDYRFNDADPEPLFRKGELIALTDSEEADAREKAWEEMA